MRVIIREASHERLYIPLPKDICRLLDYETGMKIYALVKRKDLILTLEETAFDDKRFNYVTSRSLTHGGAGKSLNFTIPSTIVLLLKYYKNQELQLDLKNKKRLYFYKLWGE